MRSGHEHPFHSRTTAQQLIAARIAEAPKPVLDALEAPATRDLAVRRIAPLAMLCLEKQPSARPASATELLTVMAAVHVFGSTSAPTTLVPKRVVIATIENKSGDAVRDPIGARGADWIARGRLLPELAQDFFVERFGREIALAAALQHANIVPVFDRWRYRGRRAVLSHALC